MTVLKRISRRLRCLAGKDHILCEGRVIPAGGMRFGGSNFADDTAFVRTGDAEAERLRHECGLSAQSRVLEIGCGTGRLPIALLAGTPPQSYCGIDVSEAAIDWCVRHIRHPAFRFIRIHARNARYNPKGTETAGKLHLPLADASCDVIYLYSVFSHLTEEDVREYLGEFARVLTPAGAVFLTAFVEDGVPEFEENPAGYKQEWKGALHCVRFEKAYFEGLCAAEGLHVSAFSHGTETDGQSAYVLRKN